MWDFNPNFLAQMLQPKFLAFLLTSFKCHWRLSFRQNFLLLVLHSKAFALTKLKPNASFLADDGAKANSLRNLTMPSPPRPPPAIQPRIPGIQRMINTQSGLKRNNYAFYFVKNPNRQFSSGQPRSSDCVLVQNPAQRGMSQRKRKKIIIKKGRVRCQLDGNSVLRIKTSKPGPDICCTCSPLFLSSSSNNRGHSTMSIWLKRTQQTAK